MARPILLGPALRPTCIALQIVPVPGVGAIIAGAKNPHSPFLKHGIAQTALVVFGSYPLIIPGAIGLIWAIWDAVAIARRSVPDAPWAHPTPDADPETVQPTRDEKRAARAAGRAAARADREARRAEKAADRAERKAAKAKE